MTFWKLLRQGLQGEQPIHPIQRAMAKRCVKERLKWLFSGTAIKSRGTSINYTKLTK